MIYKGMGSFASYESSDVESNKIFSRTTLRVSSLLVQTAFLHFP